MSAPEAMTYDSLVSDIQSYAERSDEPFLSQIPRLIMMTENRLASEVRTLGFKRFVSGTLSVGGAVMKKPIRWRETESFSFTGAAGTTYLKLREYEYCRAYWPDTSLNGVPRYYADYDYEHFFIVPTPATGYSFELSYYERPEPLSEANQTNWTTQYAPQLLLYGTLLEAQPWLKTPERIPEFQGLYDRALAALLHEDQRRVQDAQATRNKG